MIQTYQDNPELAQDMVATSYRRFMTTGRVLIPEQRLIYEQLATILAGRKVLEAGCGIGLGTSILARQCAALGTDVSPMQVAFARQMFPCDYNVWDIASGPYVPNGADVVVAVEVIEHLRDYRAGLTNLVASASHEVWLSTPNRNNPSLSDERPNNQHHVHEFTPDELLQLAGPLCKLVTVHHWDGLEEVDSGSDITPLLYHLML